MKTFIQRRVHPQNFQPTVYFCISDEDTEVCAGYINIEPVQTKIAVSGEDATKEFEEAFRGLYDRIEEFAKACQEGLHENGGY